MQNLFQGIDILKVVIREQDRHVAMLSINRKIAGIRYARGSRLRNRDG